MEGKEVRFGEPLSALFGAATTLTSTGAVNSMHDSYTPLGGGVVLLNMMLGEVAPGGVGSGLYGMLVLAVVAVFVAGLMVGRTPEYLGKQLGRREMTLASLYLLATPALVLVGTAVAIALPAGRGVAAQRRPARAVRGALRLHVGRQQQRLGLRRALGEHALLQHRPRAGDGRSAASCRSCWSSRSPVGWPRRAGPRSPPARSPPTARCSSGCSPP